MKRYCLALFLLIAPTMICFGQNGKWSCRQAHNYVTNDEYYVLSQTDALGSGTVMSIEIDKVKTTPLITINAPNGSQVDVDADNSQVQQFGNVAADLYIAPPDEKFQTIKMRFSGASRASSQEWLRSQNGYQLISMHASSFLRTLQKAGKVYVAYSSDGAGIQSEFIAGSTDCMAPTTGAE